MAVSGDSNLPVRFLFSESYNFSNTMCLFFFFFNVQH